jgi:gliding motility-associated-like protein
MAFAHNNGCRSQDTLELKISCSEIQVPTGFSPNGDGVNDRFRLYGTDNVKQVSFRIYNRWGQVVYESHDAEAEWDGHFKGEDTGTQTVAYLLEAELRDGRTQHQTGNITIIR